MVARSVRSYVLREGRMTTGQHRALQSYWPRYGLAVDDGCIDLRDCFARQNPLVVEIGFGMGDSLAEMAVLHRDTNFIGIEVHRPGVGHLLRLAADAQLDNLKVFNADSVDVFERCIAQAIAERIQIFFPDPWPKKRHHKRRLITPAFSRVLQRALKPGGILHIATDSSPYAQSIVEVIAVATSLEPTSPPERPVTKYERRGLKLGHRVSDLAWIKGDERLLSP